MISSVTNFLNVFKIEDLRKKILFTLFIIVVYRIGAHIPVPGIDFRVLAQFFAQNKGTLLGFYDYFSGGALRRATIFALGIMPYISASIILQLLGAVWPYLQKLQQEGEEGRRKINQWTRYGTVALAAFEAYGISLFLETLDINGARVVLHPGIGFRLLTVLTLTGGTIFIMWLGEKITEKGIGNGISIIIMVGIIARMPGDTMNAMRLLLSGALNPVVFLLLLVAMAFIVAGVVYITQAQRRIPVQYAKRVVGRKVYGGQSTYIPLNLNAAGVIPIIFAQSVIMFPTTLARFFMKGGANPMQGIFSPGDPLYTITYMLLIIFFAYFYTAIVINPQDLANNMKKYGGFIPGIRPGEKTRQYIDKVLTRITLPGAIFFAIIAILPIYLIKWANVPFYFGGTSLIIVVGVILDTFAQMESYLTMRHYEGFLKSGKLKGRR